MGYEYGYFFSFSFFFFLFFVFFFLSFFSFVLLVTFFFVCVCVLVGWVVYCGFFTLLVVGLGLFFVLFLSKGWERERERELFSLCLWWLLMLLLIT